MSSEWISIPVSEFCLSVRDGTHDSPKEVLSGGKNLVTSRHIKGGLLDLSTSYKISDSDCEEINKRSKVDQWDILFSMIGTVGEVLLVKEPPDFAIKNVGLFKSKDETTGKWLYYYLQSPNAKEEIYMSMRGSTQQYIPLGALRSFPIRHPQSTGEMRGITDILGTLDDKIELNRKTNETLEAMAKALFKSWFVDFDPVRAKVEGRPTGLPSEISDLFPDSFEDSELGEIPKGWKVKSLDKVAHFLNGLALQKFPPEDGAPTLPVIKIAQLKKGDSIGADRCSTAVPSDYVVRDGDMLFSWSGSLAVDIWCGGDGALNQHLFKVTSKTYVKWFFYQWVKHHLPEFQEIAQGKATTMGHIQRHHLSEAKVLIPPPSLLAAMDSAFTALLDRAFGLRRQAKDLGSIRDALLPKLISGELRIPDAEKMDEEVGV
ncbi:MAG: restriction endonuclease subunit S [Cyanobacteriota bacterium]